MIKNSVIKVGTIIVSMFALVVVFCGSINISVSDVIFFEISALESEEDILHGDLNGDGNIDSTDYHLLARYILEITDDFPVENYMKVADLNGDGLIDSSDAILLKRYILDIINEFPVETSLTPEPTPEIVPTTPSFVPSYREASVHDPSVIKVDGYYYIIGSHLAFAKTDDLIQWEQINSSVHNRNSLIPNVYDELKESFEWAETDTMWAGDIVRLNDGRYYMYYCLCKGDSPRSTLGLAVADNVEGSYRDEGILLKSGMWGEPSEDGREYDATVHPNAIDPHVFFDNEGELWMVYGSYSGGIFILKMDADTGKPVEGQGYGKKLLGENHSRIEAPYILYSSESEYYYLFLSYGGLDAAGGYNIRVARSKNPDGPYYDGAGNEMIDAKGSRSSFFDDAAIEPYGVKLLGNFQFLESGIGYVSPGHNSAYYDEEQDKYYIFFHTRFPGRDEMHQVRVHQMFINEDGWPVIAPHRYAKETIRQYLEEEVSGTYEFINHGKDISANIKDSIEIKLESNGTISGSLSGTWQLKDGNDIVFEINGENYKGVVLQQWDDGLKKYVMTFSALAENVAIWGSKVN
ncbi:family 43 glycosylhydrolase [Herbivorax sp. ANBcel31]|uniref:family 43 glycosylhydrolase n=1 Tax=Herbivorax sp. ANBcel31 TaxID=3069754 RepID=UPI0027AE6131|nr:family 43 glycosylhydrolase [Herbivorax sp. ANBcel31]MDQ2088086.1 family 43 glycosylhydrolase [Herbivorax sp. ANBcel31]